MNISRLIVVLLVLSCLFLASCANSPQSALRGNPNAPWTNMQYLQLNPNAAMKMSPAQYNEYARRVEGHNRLVAQQLRNDQQAARNAQTWTGNVNRDRYSTGNIVRKNADKLIDRWVRSIEF